MRFCYLFFIALSAFAQTAPGADEAGSIAGQVVRADSGEPLSRVMVTFRKVDARSGAPLAATTAVDGRFAIKGVAPGQYRLWANRNGFLTAEYGQKSYGKPGTPISVTAKQHIQDVSLRMMQAGAISGRAVNEASERLAYVRVQALRQVYSQGRKQWMSAGMATTNDLGEYRIFGLAARTLLFVRTLHLAVHKHDNRPRKVPAEGGRSFRRELRTSVLSWIV